LKGAAEFVLQHPSDTRPVRSFKRSRAQPNAIFKRARIVLRAHSVAAIGYKLHFVARKLSRFDQSSFSHSPDDGHFNHIR
jgi:hypothetical protein